VKDLVRSPVVVVEDSNEDFDTVETAYRMAASKHRLHRTLTGEMCLRLLRAEGVEQLRPALLLLDLNTPAADGREALVVIRRDPALRQMPVVVLSVSSDPRDVAYCYCNGANAYHVKPVRYAEHLQLLVDIFSYWLRSAVLPEYAHRTS
jgi:CheY-like chemotaxis protein